MEDSSKAKVVDTNSKVIGEIVSYLKNYPFLLISVAGLLILVGILIFDKDKLEIFKWLIYLVVLAPIGLQFLLEFKKQSSRSESMKVLPTASLTANSVVEGPVATHPQHFSRKVIISLALLGLLLLTLVDVTQKGLSNTDFHIGALILMSIPALLLSFSAMHDVRQGRVKGKGWATATIVLSLLMIFFSLGQIQIARNEIPGWTPQEDSVLQGIQPVPESATYTDAELAAIASQINARLQLPRMIDNVTRLDSTVGAKNILQYQYTLVGIPTANISEQILKDELETNIVNNVCTSKELVKYFISKGVTVSYAYYGSDGNLIGVISVAPSQCQY